MTLSRSDRTELLLPLFAGLFDASPWQAFLRSLAARTGADRVLLVIQAQGADRPFRHHRAMAPQGDPARFPTRDERAAVATFPLAALRVGRVYALDELRDNDGAERRERQDARLAAARIGDARLMRVPGQSGPAAWLVVLAERAAFDAIDSVLLADLAPAIEIALRHRRTAGELRLRAEASEATLARLGIGQAVLDTAGQIVVADAAWRRGPAPSPSEIETAPGPDESGEARLVRTIARPALVRRFPGGAPVLDIEPAVIATTRVLPPILPPAAVAIAAGQFGLSPREAALAVALAEGHALVEAGATLGLTAETTRTYSKRLYAKTGARGQADLVRLILSSLAVLG